MISILHEPDYEMLGDVEVHRTDWLRLQSRGAFRFVADFVGSSILGRAGAFLLLLSAGGIRGPHQIEGWARMLLVLGAWYVVASNIHGVRAWLRLKRRFSH
jgi:hypothetical protein